MISRAGRTVAFWVVLSGAIGSLSCSIPNLEAPECTAARGVVRELYSYHFGNDMHFSPQTMAERQKYLTPELFAALERSQPGVDPFTLVTTDDPPKAFRVGSCKARGDSADVEVLLFWKTDARSEQRGINAEAVKRSDKWLVNDIRTK